jgi:hypothetical protein
MTGGLVDANSIGCPIGGGVPSFIQRTSASPAALPTS